MLVTLLFARVELLPSCFLQILHFLYVKMGFPIVILRWIRDRQVAEELEIDESKEGLVEFEESSHDFIVDVEWQSLVELVRSDPSDTLAHDLDLIINTLD